MKSENRILVVVDPTVSGEQICVQRAAWLAKSLDMGIELLFCDYEQILTHARAGQRKFIEESRQWTVRENRKTLEKMAKSLRDEGLDVIVSSVWDQPLDEGIVRHVLRTEPRMVIKDTHYHSKLRRTFFTNTDWNLVRNCPVPVWLSKPHAWPTSARIIAAVDPDHEHDVSSSLDKVILNEATMLVENLSGELHAFHSYLPSSMHRLSSMDARVPPLEELEANIEQHRSAALDELLDDYTVLAQNTHLLAGDASKLLPELATDLDAGLVVMGSIARNMLESVFVGSTTEKVLDKIPCDLLVLKPTLFATTVTPGTPEYYQGTRDKLPAPHISDSDEFGSSFGSTF